MSALIDMVTEKVKLKYRRSPRSPREKHAGIVRHPVLAPNNDLVGTGEDEIGFVGLTPRMTPNRREEAEDDCKALERAEER